MTPITTPPFLSLEVPGDMQRPTLSVQAVFSQAAGRYVAASVTLANPMAPVTTRQLAASALRRTMAEQLRAPVLAANPQLGSMPVIRTWAKGTGHTGRRPAAGRVAEPSAELLHTAALVLRLERLVGGHTVKTLARCFHLEHEEAMRWAGRIRRLEQA